MDNIKKIKKSFLIIEKNVYNIVEMRYVFKKFYDFIKDNQKLTTDDFINIILGNYIDVAIIEVCKQYDEDSKSESIINLLKNIKNNNNLFSLKWFLKNHSKYTKDIGEKNFKQFYIKKSDKISRKIIDQDIKKLKIAIKGRIYKKKVRFSKNSLLRLRNKRKAHYDKKNFITKAGMKDLDNAINVLEEIILKYGLLLNQSFQTDGLLASNVDDYIDFKEIFKK